jgi:ribosomal protein S18 acetylase RimI-like enzyme
MRFLRVLYAKTGSFENWLPARFENNRREMDPSIRVWEDDGEIVGFVIAEEPLVYFVQLNPDYLWLYDEMVIWIEEYSRVTWNGKLAVIEMEGQTHRAQVLRDRGFTRERVNGIFRVRDIDETIPDYRMPDGFKIRSVTPDDFDELASCIRLVFGHSEFDRGFLDVNASASYYVPDLDLVVVDEAGTIVSFCTFRLDVPSGLTELEPMGTLANYRNLGIGRALIVEGFKRLQKYNPSLLYIGGAADKPPANRLYELTGFTERYNLVRWEKTI